MKKRYESGIFMDVDLITTSEEEAQEQLVALRERLGFTADAQAVRIRRHIEGIIVPETALLIKAAAYVVTPFPDKEPTSIALVSESNGIRYKAGEHSDYGNGLIIERSPHAISTAIRNLDRANPAPERRDTVIGDIYALGYQGLLQTYMLNKKTVNIAVEGLERLEAPALTVVVHPDQTAAIHAYIDSACG